MSNTRTGRRIARIGLAGALVVSALAVTTTSFAAGQRPDAVRGGVDVACRAGDRVRCETGMLRGPRGGVAKVVLNDADRADAMLEAAYTAPLLTCIERGYVPTSDQLVFDVNVDGGGAGLTQTVTMSKPLAGGSTDPTRYEVCFAAPYRFPAVDLRPGQFAADTRRSDFSNNTDPVADFGKGVPGNKGILPQCSDGLTPDASAGETYAPCVVSRRVDVAADLVTVVIEVPAADPGTRF